MPRYDQEPDYGFPLPPQMQEAFKALDEMEERNLRIRALAQTLAEPEHILARKEMAAKMRAEKGIKDPPPRRYIPGLIDGAGSAQNVINQTGVGLGGSGLATPMPNAGNAEQANSPLWYRAVELAVDKLGFDANRTQLRAEAMKNWSAR
jgi:hypothetical protein